MKLAPSSMRALTGVAIVLWIAVPLPLLAAAVADPVITFTDIAREKDVVWLSLATTITAIGFSGWLVRQMLLMAKSQTDAAMKQADALYELKEELSRQTLQKP